MSLYVNIEKDFGEFKLRTGFETNGEVLGILGASGCGKSITLRCIAGIIKPDRGKIVLNGTVLFDSEKKINLPPQKRQVGLLFQNYALFPNMTVWQNLMTGVTYTDKKEAKKHVRKIIEKFYLTGLEKHKPSQLSGGQQQRVALARILLTRPQLLMLDEPFSALDGYLRWKLELELMDILKEFGGSTLFVSHSRDEVYRICDKVCVMDYGKSTPVISVNELFKKPETLAAAMLLGCKNYSEAEPVGEHLIYAKKWGEILTCLETLDKTVKYIGIRSHYIHPVTDKEKELENVFECKIMRIVEDLFSVIVLAEPLRASDYMSKSQNGSQIHIEVTKEFWQEYCGNEKKTEGMYMWIQIEPKDVMLLK